MAELGNKVNRSSLTDMSNSKAGQRAISPVFSQVQEGLASPNKSEYMDKSADKSANMILGTFG